ncbi:hypothetical protein KIPB_004454 [Kipferlia bialata]|uniref:Large ribosomal subunit protein eL14 domain-containing protein n=1 Tax=Kipferlia bialata TaxID=797122 RepID=A0A391NKM3_9EUKA|nr:hypothetical protein KIPB_004454 [Kipferlia bialata]|eukprot:g4454.t1
MTFTRFVEVGRLVYIDQGKFCGKVAVIYDIIDRNLVMIDGPTTGVSRSVCNVKHIVLTKHTVGIERAATSKQISAALKEEGAMEAFTTSKWGMKIAGQIRRKQLTDFERFQVKLLKQRRAQLLK